MSDDIAHDPVTERWLVLSIVISLFALLATFYQLYLQRLHNKKSLKPLPQIVLSDHERQIFVQLRNNGVGPLIIEKFTFIKNGVDYSNIEDCMDINPKTFMHDSQSHESMRQVILPGSFLNIFETRFGELEAEPEINHIRRQLAPITLKVSCRDIYENKIAIERHCGWFTRFAA